MFYLFIVPYFKEIIERYIMISMKQKLMDTAMRLWKQYGYNDISINRICEECGVTKGSFYHHFDSKEDVVSTYINKRLTDLSYSDEDICDSYIETIYNLIIKSTLPVMELSCDMINVAMQPVKQKKDYQDELSFFKNSEIFSFITQTCIAGQESGEIRDNFSVDELLEVCLTDLLGNIRNWSLYGKQFDLLEKDKKDLYIILKK